jgi:hypothetical protein
MLKRSKARDGAKCEEGEARCGVGAEPTIAREGEREGGKFAMDECR